MLFLDQGVLRLDLSHLKSSRVLVLQVRALVLGPVDLDELLDDVSELVLHGVTDHEHDLRIHPTETVLLQVLFQSLFKHSVVQKHTLNSPLLLVLLLRDQVLLLLPLVVL